MGKKKPCIISYANILGKESRSSASSNKTSSSYEWNMSFRPRRRTASTSGCSSRACAIHGGGAGSSSLKSPLNINHSNHQNETLSSLGNRMEAVDLIERCSSGSHRLVFHIQKNILVLKMSRSKLIQLWFVHSYSVK